MTSSAEYYSNDPGYSLPMSNVENEMHWKFTLIDEFSVKSATWANNTTTESHQRLNSVTLYMEF